MKLRGAEETEINGAGPKYSDTDLEKLYEKLNHLENGDYLILAGSIPPSMPSGIYVDQSGLIGIEIVLI